MVYRVCVVCKEGLHRMAALTSGNKKQVGNVEYARESYIGSLDTKDSSGKIMKTNPPVRQM